MKFLGTRLASIAAVVAIAFLIEVIATNSSDFAQRLFTLAAVYVTLSVSLNLINGITGQFSIGHAAFYQVGAYTAAFMTTHHFAGAGLSKPLWLAAMITLGAVTAAIAGLVVGLPSLRLRGDYLAIVTLGFGEIIRIVVQNQPALGGASGLSFTPSYRIIWMAWLLAFLCIAVCRNLLKTGHGLSFLAVREDEVASNAMGINTTRVKVTAFVIGSAFAGMAGAVYGQMEGFISPASFTMDVSFIILTMVVLGGTGSITGSALAGALLFFLPEKLRDVKAIPVSGVLAGLVAVVATVWVIKYISEHVHRDRNTKARMVFGSILGSIGLTLVLSLLLKGVPSIGAQTIDGSKMRMVIFAVTLVVLMLLRPQGVFAHHEFSWNWLKGLLNRKKGGKIEAGGQA